MIDIRKSVPEVYYNQSRDFQAIARSFEVLFNYLKTNADILKGFPFSENFDVKLLTLLAYTIGFESKHNYNTKDLFNLCSTFAELLKNKGSQKSIELAIITLLNAQAIKQEYGIAADNDDAHNLVITLPYAIQDLVLLEDLFDYILPSGFTYSFKFADFAQGMKSTQFNATTESKSVEYTSEDLGAVGKPDDDADGVERFDYENPQDELQQLNTGVVVLPPDEE